MTYQEETELSRYKDQRLKQFNAAYMTIAFVISTLSYCQKKKVGVIIVKDGNIVGYGFNGTVHGLPNICEDDEGANPNSKDVHAEMNAILKAGILCKGAEVYTTCYPCEPCTRLMAQAGIIRIFYSEDYKVDGRIGMYGMMAIKL